MPAIKLHPKLLLKWHNGHKVEEERSFNAKGVITKTNICVVGRRRPDSNKMEKLQDKFKNTAEAIAFIDKRTEK
jgi:hypothetical protein